MSFISRLWPPQPEAGSTALVVTTLVTTVALWSLLRYSLVPVRRRVIVGPLKTAIPKLSQSQIQQLDYSPHDIPGARDVVTPYGSIRVYEWGPESGPKVLMVHGISTSCQTLYPIARALVGKGCRLMLFDLFGRGFSDGVGDLPHDERLYVSQILLALSSSPLPWTGTDGFRLIGYSMGGGISVHFAATFPHLVESLVLLAPAGLIRAANFGTVTRFVFTSGLIPERLLAAVTKRRLQQPIAASAKKGKRGHAHSAGNGTAANGSAMGAAAALLPDADASALHPVEPVVDAALTEAADPDAAAGESVLPIEERVLRYVRWMLTHHAGFIPAFMSCIRFAPLIGQHDAFRQLARRRPGTTTVVLGRADEIIDPDDYAHDALPLLGGPDNVHWEVVPGGHDFPMTHVAETLAVVYDLWRLK